MFLLFTMLPLKYEANCRVYPRYDESMIDSRSVSVRIPSHHNDWKIFQKTTYLCFPFLSALDCKTAANDNFWCYSYYVVLYLYDYGGYQITSYHKTIREEIVGSLFSHYSTMNATIIVILRCWLVVVIFYWIFATDSDSRDCYKVQNTITVSTTKLPSDQITLLTQYCYWL